MRLGWSYKDQQLLSLEEMTELFDIADVNSSASAFNPDKLRWLNKKHIISTPAVQLEDMLVPYMKAIRIDPANGPNPAMTAEGFHERADTVVEMVESSRYCYKDFDGVDAKSKKRYLHRSF